MNKKAQSLIGLKLGIIALLGLFAFFSFTISPSTAEADFFDDFVDFLNPVTHVENILDGRPQDNLPPIPGFSGSDDSVTTIYIDNTIYTCQDSSAINYGGSLPCRYHVQTCQDPSARNHGGSLPCRYYAQTCRDSSAINYGGNLPCRYYQTCGGGSCNYNYTFHNNQNNRDRNPTVDLDADDTSIDYGDNTRIRWSSDDATRCDASGGTNGWSDNNIGTHGTFNTGSLYRDETYRITCRNNYGDTDSDSITIRVDDDENDDDDEPDVRTRNATNINTGNATLNGEVDGNNSSVRAWFEYGTNTNLGSSTSQSSYGSRSTNYSRNISGLYPNTTYYFRAVAENSQRRVYGNILSFHTGANSVYYPPVNNQLPTVGIAAEQINLPFNGATSISWYTTNATSCNASGGSVGWAGAKNIGPGSFYTGSLTTSRTYTITCSNNVGSSTDSITITVRPQTITTPTASSTPRPTPTSLVLITSSVDRNQPVVPTLDNTRPRPGDEINYTVSYQNIGTGTITGLVLQIELPREVLYLSSNPNNPNKYGNTLIFNLETLGANSQGLVTVLVKVLDDIPSGTNLNFPATLSYVDPSGLPRSINVNVSAQISSESETENLLLGANVLGAGFLPTNIFEWLILFILTLILILLIRHLLVSERPLSFSRQAVAALDEPSREKNATTIHQ